MVTALLSYNDNGCTRAYKYLLKNKTALCIISIILDQAGYIQYLHNPVPALSLYLSLLLTLSKLVLICTVKCNVAKKHGLIKH